MQSVSSTLGLILVAVALASSTAFVSPSRRATVSPSALNDGGDKINFPNPLAELGNMFSNLDDIIDDFFNKRMGNGEIFYGKRKYNPSGNVDSDYNGGGFSDFRKIEAAREFRAERAMMREEAKKAKEQQLALGKKNAD